MSKWYDNQTDYTERRVDSDLAYARDAMRSDNEGFEIEDVAYVLAEVMGENDGPSWHWICAMKDHTYAYATGWCGYTGWGCQDGGYARLFPSLKEALNAVESSEIQSVLRKQLTGVYHFGSETK